MALHEVICYFSVGDFFAGLTTEDLDSFDPSELFPSPWKTAKALEGFEVLGPGEHSAGTGLPEAAEGDGYHDPFEDCRGRFPTEEENETVYNGGVSVMATGTCTVTVDAASPDAINERTVLARLPSRFLPTDLADFVVEADPSV